ncbi:MAG TPA: UdgX family uracil-DNA binding protein [Verrucomicrobiae bacterium]|nr:UdgX family uracil-DNA binding protein [Verrucomicrobiae bacterium]
MPTLETLRREAAHCERCELYRRATQTVFGEGTAGADLMLVGEEPGDREDLAGRPFVGPAGALLHTVLAEVAPARSTYITNAVKHFNFIERGKRRIHVKPKVIHIEACEPWLDAEVAAVQPRLIVALGATAVRALLGPGVGVLENRGKLFPSRFGIPVLVTIHPAAILRAIDTDSRRRERKSFANDLRRGIALFDRGAMEETVGMATRKKTTRKKTAAKKSTAKRTTAKKTTAKKKTTRKYSKKAGSKVKKVMEEFSSGKLRSGRSGKKVTSRKQAIAIGISEARAEGDKVPSAPKRSR